MLNAPAKSIVILAARLVARGDVHGARALLATRRFAGTFRVFEIRALDGAVRHARRVYGMPASITAWSLGGGRS